MTTSIKTNSNLLPRNLEPDTYHMYNIDSYLNNEDIDWEVVKLDRPKRVRAVSEKILECILESDEIEELSKAWITINKKVLDIFSPREYNFATDWFDFEITVDEDMMGKYVWSDTKFDEYLKENYSSYDWFTSFMPKTIWQWLSWDYDLERRAMCIVSYILEKMDFEWSELELCEDAYECIIYPTNKLD